ncbi:hypothetical protein Fot_35149 [Forsythia ovata]|uniref:Uncharacterized protein n=1 Tax=Forsythia ovata TaxID=205694 RepID=A0ABD1SLD5_9LAMI
MESLQKELFNFKESAEWKELYEDGKQAWGRELLALIQDEHLDIKFNFLFEGNDAEPSEGAFSTASEPIEEVLPTDALSTPPSWATPFADPSTSHVAPPTSQSSSPNSSVFDNLQNL